MAKKYISKENFELIWAVAKLKLAAKLDNPDGGEEGYILSKTDDGAEWIDIDGKYATKEELQQGLEEVDITDQLEDFVKKEELEDYAKKDEVLTADVLDDYAKKDEVLSEEVLKDYVKKEEIEDFVTEEELEAAKSEIEDTYLKKEDAITEDDLKDFAKKSDVDAVQSDLDDTKSDLADVKSDLETNYATKDEIADFVSSEDFNELTETVNGIKEDYVDKETFESLKSDFEAVQGDYVTEEELEAAKSEVKNDIIGTAPGTYETLTAIAEYIRTHGEAAGALAEQIALKADKTDLDDYYTKDEIDAMELTKEEIDAILNS